MSLGYRAVGWNRQKKIYDVVMLAGIALYLGVFIIAGLFWHPNVTAETLFIRALGTCAFVLLNVILIIGPLCRLDDRFLPLLYNRRHMGVAMFMLALAHGAFSIIQYHALGNINPLLSVLTSNVKYASLSEFPFEILGVLALVILFLMAATSHDFWLVNLTAPLWKALHMMVYVAYALIIMHVALGFLQAETSLALTLLFAAGMSLVLGLHVLAALKEKQLDQNERATTQGDFIDACGVNDIPERCAQIVTIAGERVAIFKYDGKISAVSNVCQHQNGPLGEGRIIDGCITCPWHGYQYVPENGSSPPPFTEKIPTFNVRVESGRVLVRSRPNAPGTFVEPAKIA